MAVTPPLSPFHRGEREIQTRLGVREQVEAIGQRFIRDHLPDEHRAFYAQLPFLLIGAIDKSGRPWASILAGHPGFVRSPDPSTLEIHAHPIAGDPLNDCLSQGAPVGLLGIEYPSRRRNRMTGKVKTLDERHITIKVDQSFGNCPQYIQARDFDLLPAIDNLGEARPRQNLEHLDERACALISQADHFYIATHFSENAADRACGADVSHRGGKPGFVRVDGDRRLTYPDFVGNNHFNTLGNLLLNPHAGLLFIDFDSGDLLYLTCTAEIIWNSEEGQAFDGAERLVSFTLDRGLMIEQALPIRWHFKDYSPSLEKTGSWAEVAEQARSRNEGNIYRNYRVLKVVRESEVISSFYLQPEDGGGVACHKAGQFLPIEIRPPGLETSIQRTYTISNAPNGATYRLSIKREPAAQPELPAGVASNYFHDQVRAGDLIRAMSPRGKFILDESSTRPVVLISAGVGITPMISMLEALVNDSVGCGGHRGVWFVHGASHGSAQAFAPHVRALAKDRPWLRVHVRYSRPAEGDREGRDYDSAGHVDIDLLKSLLPFDDYEFYLCGPAPFMASLYAGLQALNVADERIHYEFFSRGATLHHARPKGFESFAEALAERVPVAVRFARSGIDATWEPSTGTLLDLAESKGLQPAYSCRSGICQTCSCRIISGAVEYLEPPMTTPGQQQALICCSYPGADGDAETDGLILDL